MLRSLDRRDDGFELFELTAIDDLDFESFLPMLDRAWRADYSDQVRLDFDEAVLRKQTGGPWWVAVLACAENGSPVGFEMALERCLRVGDKVFRAYYATVFTVSAEHRRRGLGRWILEGINRLVFEEQKADLIVSTFHRGYAGSPTVQSTFDRLPDWGVVTFHSGSIWSQRLDRQRLPRLERPPRFTRLVSTDAASETGLRALSESDRSIVVPSLGAIDELLRREFEVSFALEASLAGQYLDAANEASGTLLYDLGGDRFALAGWNIIPMAINERALRPIGQLQFLLAPWCVEAEIERLVHHVALLLAERGCFALSLVDTGMVPRVVLESLGFVATEDEIAFAVRGPKSTISAFEGPSPPFFVDFT